MAPIPSSSVPDPSVDSSIAGLLADLQGNIVQPHARQQATHIFLSFGSDISRRLKIRSWLRTLARERVNNAWEEYRRGSSFRPSFCSLLLAARGYQFVGEPMPGNEAFRVGMAARRHLLNDPPRAEWHAEYANGDIDGLVILADDDAVQLARDVVVLWNSAKAVDVRVVLEEPGRRLRRDGRVIEHFGFLDGLSQPVFFPYGAESTDRWDPTAGLDLVLSEEPRRIGHYGSYFVFRKLEQDVTIWVENISRYAAATGLDRDLVAAFAMGRFRDGTPVVEHDTMQHAKVPSNNFNFADDPNGARCPFQAHVRKSNPRGEEPGTSPLEERRRRIVRRGITYGVRPDLHPAGTMFPPPHSGAGLLFMCYQANIEEQFEHIQARWANNPHHPREGCGVDVAVGQTGDSLGTADVRQWPADYGSEQRVPVPFNRAVRLLGGEYFFAPSVSFLHHL